MAQPGSGFTIPTAQTWRSFRITKTGANSFNSALTGIVETAGSTWSNSGSNMYLRMGSYTTALVATQPANILVDYVGVQTNSSRT